MKKYSFYYLSLPIFVFSSMALAGSYSGMYLGGFTGTNDYGFFSLYVKNDNTAVIFGYDSYDDYGFSKENISVNSVTGNFSNNNIDGFGTSISGIIDHSLVSGSFSGPYGSGHFSGNKKSFSGPYASQSGYYKGTFSTTSSNSCYGLTYNGQAQAMLSPDGEIVFFEQVIESNYSEAIGIKDGGAFQFNNSYTYGWTIGGVYVQASIQGTTISGQFDDYGCPGQFSLTRVDVLQNYDTDSDGYNDDLDNCPNDADIDQTDTDNDGLGNPCDLDDDGDTISDSTEISNGTNPLLDDTDSDGITDNLDAFPLDVTESIDTDNDDIGDNADLDDDNDGIPDLQEITLGLDPLDASDASGDIDNDGYTNLQEYLAESNPKLDTDNDGMFDLWEIENGFQPDDDSDCPSWVCKPSPVTGWRSIIYQ